MVVSRDEVRPIAPARRRHRLWRSLVSGCRGHWRSLLVAVCCGALLALAFPSAGQWWLAPLSVAVFTASASRRSARHGAALGLLFGLTFCAIEFSWEGRIAAGAWPALSIVEALYFVPLGAATAMVGRLRAAAVWQAALWVAEEAVRGRVPFGGLSWARLAFSQTHSPYTRVVALGGAPLLTFAVALTGTSLAVFAPRLRAWWVARRTAVPNPSPPRARRLAALGALAGWLLAAGAGPLVALAVPGPSGGLAGDAHDKRVTIALVQGNVPRIGLDYLGQREAVIRNHVDETLKLAREADDGDRPRPQAVIWPENSTDLDPFVNLDVRDAISAAARAIGAPILVGAVVDGPTPTTGYNEGVVWSPTTGPGAIYRKQHLVPFGEYVPFRSLLQPIIPELSRAGQYLPGHHEGVLQVGPARVGDVICFEVAYDGIVRQAVRDGGQVITVQTNNADYNNTWQPAQQLAIEQLRAVEHGRAVLVASTSGISAVIAPDGRIVQQSGQFTPALLEATVGMHTTLTLADRVGEWPEWVLAGLGTAAWLFAMTRWFRARRRPGTGVAARGGSVTPALGSRPLTHAVHSEGTREPVARTSPVEEASR